MRAIVALLLVLPVVAAAVLANRAMAYAVGVAATITFAFTIPPVGSPRVHLAEDLVALVVFLGVAFVVSTLVAGRIELLGRVERQRSALLRSVSHDLRTPLAVIEAAASDLRDGAHHDATSTRELLELISDETHRLDRLVANLLSLGRIDAGVLVPNLQSVDVRELVEAARARLDRVLRDADVRVDVPPGLPPISADHALLDQVVTNLLENAVRHSPPGTAVRVGARQIGNTVQLVVADDGPGISSEVRPTLFEPFRSGGRAGSTGVGLAICKAVVDAHGGTIAVGDSPTGGATFTVTLPIG